MILFLAGTSDSRIVAEMLQSAGVELELSVVSTYGQMLAEAKGLSCRVGALDDAGLVDWIKEHNCTAIVDGTHPYAIAATQTALKAAEQTGIPYLRLERKEESLPDFQEWEHDGEIHRTSFFCREDGFYEISVEGKDRAGNCGNRQKMTSFVIGL